MSARAVREVRGRIIDRRALGARTADAMYALHARYFADHNRAGFDADLAGKDRVILMYAGQELVGFSTIQVSRESVAGRGLAVLFSGDTIVDRDYWGAGELERLWLVNALEVLERFAMPLYWLLICSGYRTYRYLPVFFREFWPRWDVPTPPAMQSVLDTLAGRRFGSRYRNGVVHIGGGCLREGVSPVDPARLRNPHVAFFVEANPGHVRGDELACITHITPSNLTRAGLRVLRQVRGP
jgi:hypothetical protein